MQFENASACRKNIEMHARLTIMDVAPSEPFTTIYTIADIR
jgi:hypothetical protein